MHFHLLFFLQLIIDAVLARWSYNIYHFACISTLVFAYSAGHLTFIFWTHTPIHRFADPYDRESAFIFVFGIFAAALAIYVVTAVVTRLLLLRPPSRADIAAGHFDNRMLTSFKARKYHSNFSRSTVGSMRRSSLSDLDLEMDESSDREYSRSEASRTFGMKGACVAGSEGAYEIEPYLDDEPVVDPDEMPMRERSESAEMSESSGSSISRSVD